MPLSQCQFSPYSYIAIHSITLMPTFQCQLYTLYTVPHFSACHNTLYIYTPVFHISQQDKTPCFGLVQCFCCIINHAISNTIVDAGHFSVIRCQGVMVSTHQPTRLSQLSPPIVKVPAPVGDIIHKCCGTMATRCQTKCAAPLHILLASLLLFKA